MITNALNPHPYIFYTTVGAPIIFKSLNQSFLSTVSFVGSFLLLLVGSKILLALVAGRFLYLGHANPGCPFASLLTYSFSRRFTANRHNIDSDRLKRMIFYDSNIQICNYAKTEQNF